MGIRRDARADGTTYRQVGHNPRNNQRNRGSLLIVQPDRRTEFQDLSTEIAHGSGHDIDTRFLIANSCFIQPTVSMRPLSTGRDVDARVASKTCEPKNPGLHLPSSRGTCLGIPAPLGGNHVGDDFDQTLRFPQRQAVELGVAIAAPARQEQQRQTCQTGSNRFSRPRGCDALRRKRQV